MHTQFWRENLNDRDKFGSLGLDVKETDLGVCELDLTGLGDCLIKIFWVT